METQTQTWSSESDADQLQALTDIWNATPKNMQRKFLFDFINSNFRMYDDPSRNINPFDPCEGCADTEPTDRCIGCKHQF